MALRGASRVALLALFLGAARGSPGSSAEAGGDAVSVVQAGLSSRSAPRRAGAGDAAVLDQAACPPGYALTQGDVPGFDQFGRSRSNVKESSELCGFDCSERPNCLSFEWSPTEKLCNLNRVADPQKGPVKDYIYCKRTNMHSNANSNARLKQLQAAQKHSEVVALKRRRAEEVAEARLKVEARAKRKEAKRQAEEAEAKRQAEEAEAKRQAEEAVAKETEAKVAEAKRREAIQKKEAKEAEPKRKAQEVKAQRIQAERKKEAEAAQAKRKAQEVQAQRIQAERKKEAEEAEAKRKAQEAEVQRIQAERKKEAEEAEAKRREAEQKKEAEDAEAKRKAEEVEAKRKALEKAKGEAPEEAKQTAGKAEANWAEKATMWARQPKDRQNKVLELRRRQREDEVRKHFQASAQAREAREAKKRAVELAEQAAEEAVMRTPGNFRMLASDMPVHSTASRDSAVVAHLSANSTVTVLEVAGSTADGRVRGRISQPPGWISLYYPQSRLHFALPEGDIQLSSSRTADVGLVGDDA